MDEREKLIKWLESYRDDETFHSVRWFVLDVLVSDARLSHEHFQRWPWESKELDNRSEEQP